MCFNAIHQVVSGKEQRNGTTRSVIRKPPHQVQVPRDKNSLADALATLASIVEMPLYRSMESLVVEKLYQPAYFFIQPNLENLPA